MIDCYNVFVVPMFGNEEYRICRAPARIAILSIGISRELRDTEGDGIIYERKKQVALRPGIRLERKDNAESQARRTDSPQASARHLRRRPAKAHGGCRRINQRNPRLGADRRCNHQQRQDRTEDTPNRTISSGEYREVAVMFDKKAYLEKELVALNKMLEIAREREAYLLAEIEKIKKQLG